MEGQDESKVEHARDTDPAEDKQDEAKAINANVLDENLNNSVRKDLKTQDIEQNPLLHSEDGQKDENANVSGTGDVKPTNVNLKNICMGSIREKIKKQLELKKTNKSNETLKELMNESVSQEEAQKVKFIEDNKNPTNDVKDCREKPLFKSDQDGVVIEKNQEEPLLKLAPEKIDKDVIYESGRRLMSNKEVESFLLSVPPKKLATAEELAAISRAASSSKWVVYNPEDGGLAEWLNNNKPSVIRRSGGVGWIAAKTDDSIQERKNACEEELKEAWKAVVAKTDQINTDAVRKLANQFGVAGGKWIFHVTTDRVDVVWARVATALHTGKLGTKVIQAKVSPVCDTSEGEVTGMGAHVISVYNRDFTHEEQVLQVEMSLRQAKIRCMLQYKPQIYSILGIYRNNRWGLRPTIYHSQYHLKRGKSIIESTFENTWFRNETKGFGDDNEMKGHEIVSDIGLHDATQNKKKSVKKIEKNENIGDKYFTDPNNIKLDAKDKIKVVDTTKDIKETNPTVKETGKAIEDCPKYEYEKPKDKSTNEEDPGMKLLKGLGIDLVKPEKRNPLDKNDIPKDGSLWHRQHTTKPNKTKPNGRESRIAGKLAIRELELEMKDDPRPKDMEELRSKVLHWLLTAEETTEDDGDVMEESIVEASAEKFVNKDSSIETNHELVSLKVTNISDNDADDESTPMKDEKKEKADLKKPSWLKNLQIKVTKNN